MATKNYSAIQFASFLLIAFCISGCTFTTHVPKEPKFKISLDEVSKNLKGLLNFEHVNVDGMETTTNGKSTTELEVAILNGTNVPDDDATLSDFTKTIAQQLKEELNDSFSYDRYKILFITKEVDGAITKTKSKGWTFKSTDLK